MQMSPTTSTSTESARPSRSFIFSSEVDARALCFAVDRLILHGHLADKSSERVDCSISNLNTDAMDVAHSSG